MSSFRIISFIIEIGSNKYDIIFAMVEKKRIYTAFQIYCLW